MATICDHCRENQNELCEHVRVGKTTKDHKSGAWGNRFENRAARVAWIQDANASNSNFPRHACDGKKNRFNVGKAKR